MSRPLARAFALFVESPAPAVLRGARAVPHAPHVALVCDPRDALALGNALALGLRRACGAPAAIVCGFSNGGSAPALPATRALTARLAARGLQVSARGRLALVALPAEPAQVRAAAARAAAVGAPTVVVAAGPRPAELDATLGDAELVVLVARPDAGAAFVGLALAGLGELAVPVVARVVAPRPHERALAATGLAAVGGLAFGLAPALESL